MNLYFAVLQLLRGASLVIRHTICHQTISLLHLNPNHIDQIASHPGWDSLFLWLLCSTEKPVASEKSSDDDDDNADDEATEAATPSKSEDDGHSQIINWLNLSNEDDDACRTFAVVTETIGYILWHLSKKENMIWRTWGCLLATLDMFSDRHTLIIPPYIIKQRLLLLQFYDCFYFLFY